MQIQLKYLKLKNFLSYGSEETLIDFKNGMTAINGKNGTGKSSIFLDALCFCLYGKPYRSIKITELINRTNKKNAYTECEFSINNKDTYKIIRGLKPNTFKIIKNNEDIELLSAKILNQKELDKIIGVDYLIFKQTISLAISYNQPFLILEAKDKRKLVEQIFGLSIFGKMNEQLKNKIRDTNKNLELCEINIKNLFDTAKLIASQINEMKDVIKNFEVNKRNRIIQIEGKINLTNLELNIIKKQHSSNIKRMDRLTIFVNHMKNIDFSNKKKEIDKKVDQIDFTILQATKNKRNLNISDVCPTCGNVLDNTHKIEEVKKYDQIINSGKEELKLFDSDLNFYMRKIKQFNIRSQQLSYIIDKNFNNDRQIKKYEKDIIVYREDIEKVKQEKNEVDIMKLKVQYDKKKLEYDNKKIEKENLKTLAEQYKITSHILSDEGVKSYIIDRVVPMLNKCINYYLDIFDINLKIVFDKFMEADIISLNGVRESINYMSCSEGEKKRIDFAILLSIIETLKVISNWNSNLLIIDELLDSSIDEDGLERMLSTLKELSEKKKLGIMIISHRAINSKYIDNMIKIKKNSNGFSQIMEE